MKYIYGLVIFFTLFMSVVRVSAEGQDETVITSKLLDFDYKRYSAVFTGNVVLVDPELRLRADQLNVLFSSTNDVKSVTAIGHVQIWQADKVATCQKAVYTRLRGSILLIGNAVLQRPNDILSADRISFKLNGEELDSVKAEGNVRMKRITPADKNKNATVKQGLLR